MGGFMIIQTEIFVHFPGSQPPPCRKKSSQLCCYLPKRFRGRESNHLCSWFLECPTFTLRPHYWENYLADKLVSRLPVVMYKPPFLSCRKYYLIRPYRRNVTSPQTAMASPPFVISLPVCSFKLIKKSGCIELLYRWVHATSECYRFYCL